MRIIAGEFRGRTIKAPKGEGTRPTTDRVRESLMSSVNSARGGFEGAVVLDAFAGSGALGLEALSRGAANARFCERDGAAFKVVCANVEALGLGSTRARVVRADVVKEPPRGVRPPFDLVFLDPPYALSAQEALGVPAALAAHGALAEDALVVYEHASASNADADAAAAACGLALASRKKYGDTVVDILRPVAPNDPE
ncbi:MULTISPECIES: 16S rRNA (guanine(966)-N(2))-methyltransferase RsmD [Gordonibacter]|uniref:16S rRNA (Guanine(966)-N(2))-methyltransferase RsmD n=1 Tax=Gordonibacter faecis TaxID=3047475 RepID=A0ABT7DQ53_9ACTN|nr:MULTISPECIES: 16S rRNA (guanine(966)-N(2))-methyltransferase RsmD [unclassified Gordonibacter]MDJ1651690.1 16S rRNA (guanine(966)-N(2))-methyltransferase RsmD [Gordonibacter sp. KGMB12511]HIW77113.1 16S rRNA (guanine(966)-N(2))-methyltransferase RsmD [Candidatus Gordonibacter avicola]